MAMPDTAEASMARVIRRSDATPADSWKSMLVRQRGMSKGVSGGDSVGPARASW